MKYVLTFIFGFILGFAYVNYSTDKAVETIVTNHQVAIAPLVAKLDTMKPKVVEAKKKFAVSRAKLDSFKQQFAQKVTDTTANIAKDSCIGQEQIISWYEPALTDCEEVVRVQDSIIDTYTQKDSIQEMTIKALASAPKLEKKSFLRHLGRDAIIVVGTLFVGKIFIFK